MIPWLGKSLHFPPVTQALVEPDGLLAAGGDLSVSRLLHGYRHGIFPWFSPGEPILWWSPSRRMVLLPGDLHVRRSLDKVLRNKPYLVTSDSKFAEVVKGCAAPRAGQHGTWITSEIQAAYTELHLAGHAHSFEVWMDGALVGGLYGVQLGGVFFGESMFSRRTDASKIAFAHAARWLFANGIELIDCQFHTDHLATLGAHEIGRDEFLRRVSSGVAQPVVWPAQGYEHESP